jgi:signal peptidase I
MGRRVAATLIVLGFVLTGCTQPATRARAIQKSMEPTIRSGEFIWIDEHAYDTSDPQDGDIISLRAPVNVVPMTCAIRRRPDAPCRRSAPRLGDEWLIKRIIAGPGEHIAITRRGAARVNHVLIDEPYIIPCAAADLCALRHPITVPADQYFVMGDNRPYSSDSRYWGPVPRAAIQGLVTPPDPSRR